MAAKKRGLGRGLDALLGANTPATSSTSSETPAAPADENNALKELPVEYMQRGKYQPRRDMSPEALEDLSNSI